VASGEWRGKPSCSPDAAKRNPGIHRKIYKTRITLRFIQATPSIYTVAP
jgi:hypothetical protein